MKFGPIVVALMLAAFIMPTVMQKVLSGRDEGVPAPAVAKVHPVPPKLKRPPGENISVISEDEEEEDGYLQPGQASAQRDARGHFTFNAVMNGADVKVLVDTGATSVAINTSTADEMGIITDDETEQVTVNTANGETPAYRVTIDEIIIDDVVVSNVDALVLDDDSLSDTLLGMSFLKKLERFEITNDTLTLTR